MENFIRKTQTPVKPSTSLASASTAVTGAPLNAITPTISVQPPSGTYEQFTPMTQTNNFICDTIPNVPEKEKERVKKKILQLNVLSRSLGQEYNNATDNKTRWVLKNVVSNDVTKKYKLKSELTKGLGIKGRIRKLTKKQKIYKEAKEIRNFFNRDDNTRMTAGKKDTKTFKKTKYQKRFLLQSLKRLYTKYVAEGGKASFSTFRRNKPIYVKRPKLSDRDTCVCIKHNNLSQKAIKLHKLEVIDTHNLEELVTSVACNINSYECMYSKCTLCKTKKPLLNVEETDESECSWLEWQCKQYEYTKQNGDGTKNTQTTKKYVNELRTGTLSELISLFTTELMLFKTHFFNIHYQYSKYREVIDNLTENEICILVDFSENYQCKLFSEIQAMHFGASRVQITLHTGVIYSKDYEPKAFVSISPNNDHNPGAIWAHLQPVVDYVKIAFPEVTVLHFFSDGPTTQYRQKKNFYQLSQLIDQNGFSYGTWSYFEAAHGKGAADGVGGAIKRLLDQEVSNGNSVFDAMSAVNILKDITDVQIFYVSDSDIKEKQSLIPENLVPIQGTMRIHQIIYHNNILRYRDLSCFCGVERGICDCIDVKMHNLMSKKQSKNLNQESLAKAKILKRKKIVPKTRKRKISVTESDTEIDSDVTYAESDNSPYSTERTSDEDNINEAGVFQPTAKHMIKMSVPGPSSDKSGDKLFPYDEFSQEVDNVDNEISLGFMKGKCNKQVPETIKDHAEYEEFPRVLDNVDNDTSLGFMKENFNKPVSETITDYAEYDEFSRVLDNVDNDTSLGFMKENCIKPVPEKITGYAKYDEFPRVLDNVDNDTSLGFMKENCIKPVPETITDHAHCKDIKKPVITENVQFNIKKYTGKINLTATDIKNKLKMPIKKCYTDLENTEEDNNSNMKFRQESWVVVNYGIYYYVAKIISIQGSMYKVLGLKKVSERLFDWCDFGEEDLLTETHIVKALKEPKVHDTGALIFKDLPSDLNFI